MAKNTAGWSTNSNPMIDLFNGFGGIFGLPSLGGGGMMGGAGAPYSPPQQPPPAQPPSSQDQPSVPQWMGGVQGAGGASANNVFGTPLGQSMLADIMNASLAAQAYEPSQLTTDMMAAGRPSFNWGLMGAVAPLAGAMPQPEYSTPPPEFSTRYWKEYEPS